MTLNNLFNELNYKKAEGRNGVLNNNEFYALVKGKR